MRDTLKALLVITAHLCAPAASAGTVATGINEGGGKIILTDSTCVIDSEIFKDFYRIVAVLPSGVSVEGCWRVDKVKKLIWAGYHPDGKVYMYAPDDFTPAKRK